MIIKYPYPYKAWLTIANDPDNTTFENWAELHSVIWEEFGLPFSDTLFIRSFNHNLPDQVNLVDHPGIATAHPHDAIHTWGDYMHARSKGFDRDDALQAIEVLKKYSVKPKVWIDHAQFEGNLLHYTNFGAKKYIEDQSGHRYTNFKYTLDLIKSELGIHYYWDGQITAILGQDRTLSPGEYYELTSSSKIKAYLKTGIHHVLPQRFWSRKKSLIVPNNKQYVLHKFQDGTTGYCFKRFGTWKDADIYGLYNLISPDRIAELINKGGTSIVYTHLGKRPVSKMREPKHIPPTTLRALHNLRVRYDRKEIMLSSTSDLLDYLVIRDHVLISKDGDFIHFRADGIRFERLEENLLTGKRFSFFIKKNNQEEITVKVGDYVAGNARLLRENDRVMTIAFD